MDIKFGYIIIGGRGSLIVSHNGVISIRALGKNIQLQVFSSAAFYHSPVCFFAVKGKKGVSAVSTFLLLMTAGFYSVSGISLMASRRFCKSYRYKNKCSYLLLLLLPITGKRRSHCESAQYEYRYPLIL